VSGSFGLQVYADGSATVSQSLVVNSTAISVTVPLLSPVITNVIATDGSGAPLSFQISGSNITVYTVGETNVTIFYDTDSLTSKQGSVWTLALTTSYNLTVTLPQGSSVTSVSETPASLSEKNNSPIVTISPGKWKISYGVAIEAGPSITTDSSHSLESSGSTKPATGISSNGGHSGGMGFQFWYIAVASIVIIGGLGIYLLFLRRSNADDALGVDLRPDDILVLDYVSEKGGKVFEQEIRSRFALPKTSAWRQIKRLERLGYLKVLKVGSQNQIELLGKRE
jgi:uncharacterized membrane protein